MGIRIETTRPSTWVLVLSLIIVVLAIIAHYYRVPYLSQHKFWVLAIGYVVLLFGSLFGR